MLKFRSLLGARGVGMALFFSAIYPGIAAGTQVLHGHVPPAVARFNLQPTGQLPATKSLHLAIGLPLRNQEALTHLIQQLYDPASPHYHQYLTPEQFTEQFGPTEQDYQKVIAFARANGLTVTGMSANRVLLDVSGSVADIEKAFQVTMRIYRHPTEARDFFAPDTEPTVDVAVPILHVSGLDNFELPHPKLKIKPAAQTTGMTPNAGSGPGNAYMGNDFRAAYVPGVSLNGAGQTVGLLQFDGYYSSDIAAYESQAGLPSVTLVNVPVDGGVSTPGSGNDEVCLDIEMVISMAPGVSKILVYEAPNPSPWPDLLNRMANDNLAKQISCSWGGGSPDATAEQIFMQMAAQGQSFFNASGDSDAFTGSITFPSDSKNITQVGGTTLTTTGPNGFYVSETVWNDRTPNPNGGDWGSSGGISTTYSIPSWQQGINMTANHGSTTMRNVPDVALAADNVYVRYSNGSSGTFGGTSCAAPLWAGFMALVNQQAVTSGRSTVGFVNPAIYAIGKGANYAVDFHDITTGDNTWPNSPANFYAVPGYDLCTGWGTPAGQSLINALAGPADTLAITPASGFAARGAAGGPFNVTTQDFLLTDSSAASLQWTLANTSPWLNVSPGSGTLASGGQTTVTANLNSAAYNLAVGTYSANVWFTNQTTGAAQLRQFTLLVGQSLVQNGGFETGDFTGWTQSGNTAYTSVTSGNSQFVHSGTYGAILGPSGSLGYLSQTLPTFAGQNYLLSLWLDNPNNSYGATPNQFLVQWNGTTIFSQTNMPFTTWTNLQFLVTATGPSTVLQLGFRDDPYYLGLDDISATPIPVPAFRAAAKTSSSFNLAWGTMTGLVYQVQYKTNLLQTNWINLGKPLIATNGNLTVSDTNAIGSSPQRFYRLMVLP
jgi:subtilase family serine protease